MTTVFWTYFPFHMQVNNYDGWCFILNKCSELPNNSLLNYDTHKDKYTNQKCIARCIFRN